MNRIVLIGHKKQRKLLIFSNTSRTQKRRIVVISVVCQSDNFLPSLLYLFLFYFGFSKQFVLINFKKSVYISKNRRYFHLIRYICTKIQ